MGLLFPDDYTSVEPLHWGMFAESPHTIDPLISPPEPIKRRVGLVSDSIPVVTREQVKMAGAIRCYQNASTAQLDGFFG
jgi:hypothetical protein